MTKKSNPMFIRNEKNKLYKNRIFLKQKNYNKFNLILNEIKNKFNLSGILIIFLSKKKNISKILSTKFIFNINKLNKYIFVINKKISSIYYIKNYYIINRKNIIFNYKIITNKIIEKIKEEKNITGIKIIFSGKLSKSILSIKENIVFGKVSFSRKDVLVENTNLELNTFCGIIGIKIYIFK